MKQSKFLNIVAFLFLSCLAGGTEAAAPPLNPEDYYPLTPRIMTYEHSTKGTNGSITRQITIQRPRARDGSEVTPSVVSGPDLEFPITRFIQRRGDGLYIVASQVGDASTKLDAQIPVLKAPIKQGVFFDSDVKFPGAGNAPGTMHYTYSVEDTDATVTVPLGKFTNCIRMKSIIRSGETVTEVTSWLAPKTGLVRSIEIIKSNRTVTETEMLLRKVDHQAPVETTRTPGRHENEEHETMGWLTDNSIANMKGVDFLLLYVTTIVALLILGRLYIRSADTTGRELTLPPPSNPDPWGLAYLRGGVREVMTLAVFKLIQAGKLVAVGRGSKLKQVAPLSGHSEMTEMERAVYEKLATPQTISSLWKRLSSRFREICSPLEQRLLNDRLLTPRAVLDRARLVRRILLSVIFLLGGYKLFIALSRGRTNVIFLIIVGFLGMIFTLGVTRAPLLSKRGRKYLKQLRVQFQGQKDTISPLPEIVDSGPDLALLVALFGFGALQGTAYAGYTNMLGGIHSSSSWDSSSDTSGGGGGGGGSDGGGCGGCGGGD